MAAEDPICELIQRHVRGMDDIYATHCQMPLKSIDVIRDDLRRLQRAHMVLATIMHYYVHSLPQADVEASIVVPKSVAVPLSAVSQLLQMAPVLTFADTVLWNWEFIDPTQPLSIDNMRYVNNFSGTQAENNFYLASAAVELKGVEMLDIFEGFMNLRDATDTHATSMLARDLTRLVKIIEELESIFVSMRNTVDPHDFYWNVRQWWSGATSKGPNHPGWVLEGVRSADQADLGGASAGQSSVMHALDIFLDIDHRLQDARTPAPSDNNRRADHGFMDRMRRYMPGLHREYLENLSSVREIAERTPSLREPYNAAVMALKRLRDSHIRIVAIYVISKANSTPPANIRVDKPSASQRDGPSRGTGGSEVSTLLKAGRDATQRAVLK